MILSSHAIIGAAIARALPTHPILAFFLGLLSHLLLDKIPHWQYPLGSVDRSTDPTDHKIRRGSAFHRDFLWVSLDLILGILAGFLFFPPQTTQGLWTTVLAVFGSLLPDGLTFVYEWGWHHAPLAYFRRLHLWFHAQDRSLENNPLLGIPLQVIIIAAVALIISSLHF